MNVPLLGGLVVLLTGLAGLAFTRNGIKLVMCLGVLGNGLVTALLALAYREGGSAPIVGGGDPVDPMPHALLLTFVVIQFGLTALALALVLVVHERTGSVEIGHRPPGGW